MTALSSSLHRDNQQSLPRRASSKSDRGLASGAPNVSTSSSTASQSTLGDYNLEGKTFLFHVCVLLGLIISLLVIGEELPYSETLEKKKRKYSEKLYQWTQEMWNNTKQDME